MSTVCPSRTPPQCTSCLDHHHMLSVFSIREWRACTKAGTSTCIMRSRVPPSQTRAVTLPPGAGMLQHPEPSLLERSRPQSEHDPAMAEAKRGEHQKGDQKSHYTSLHCSSQNAEVSWIATCMRTACSTRGDIGKGENDPYNIQVLTCTHVWSDTGGEDGTSQQSMSGHPLRNGFQGHGHRAGHAGSYDGEAHSLLGSSSR